MPQILPLASFLPGAALAEVPGRQGYTIPTQGALARPNLPAVPRETSPIQQPAPPPPQPVAAPPLPAAPTQQYQAPQQQEQPQSWMQPSDAGTWGLIAAGLGILANNYGNYGQAQPAIGRGGLIGLDTYLNERQRQATNSQIERNKFKELELQQAYVFRPDGEIDKDATLRRLAAVDPALAFKFQMENEQYQTNLMKRSTEQEKLVLERQKEEAKQFQNKRNDASNAAMENFFQAVQGGMPEDQAMQQAQLVHTGILQHYGLPPEPLDPSSMQIDFESGEVRAPAGELIKVAKAKGPPPAPPGLAPTPEEQGQQPLTAQPAPSAPKNYNWQLAYIYTARRLDKYNPQTADFVLDYRTGQPMENTPRTQALLSRARAGKTDVYAAGGDIIQPGSTARNTLDKDIIDTENALARVEDVMSQFKPEYLELPTQASMFGLKWAEKAGVPLTAENKKALTEYTQFNRTALDNLNRYIKEITGAQMSENEAARLREAMPDPKKDSSTEFKAKAEDTLRTLRAARNRYLESRAKGWSLEKATKEKPLFGQPQPKGKAPVKIVPAEKAPWEE